MTGDIYLELCERVNNGSDGHATIPGPISEWHPTKPDPVSFMGPYHQRRRWGLASDLSKQDLLERNDDL